MLLICMPTSGAWELEPEFLMGDMNQDGEINSEDLEHFKAALIDPEEWKLATSYLYLPFGDFNDDDVFNSLDITGFKKLVVPEPQAPVLLGGAVVLLLIRRRSSVFA